MNKEPRTGCRDIWNAFMCKGAIYSDHDIPYCPTTAHEIPVRIIAWDEAVRLYRKNRGNSDFFFPLFVSTWMITNSMDQEESGKTAIALSKFLGILPGQSHQISPLIRISRSRSRSIIRSGCELSDIGWGKTASLLSTMCAGEHLNHGSIAGTEYPRTVLSPLVLSGAVHES